MAVIRILRCNPWGGSGIDFCEKNVKNKTKCGREEKN